MNSESIKAQLRAAGVPREAFATTLAKEGMTELRAYITDKAYETNKLVYIHQAPSRTAVYADKAELGFYLLAKELVISGQDVFCCNLVDVHTALFKETDEAYELSRKLDDRTTGFIGIRYFHDKGGRVDQFMTPYEAAYFYSWLIRKYQDGVGFILLGSSPVMEAVDWWPASFLGYIRSRSAMFEVRK